MMANFRSVMETVFKAEHSGPANYLHLNRKESTYTYMGVYPYTKLQSHNIITRTMEDFGNIKEASIALSKSKALTEEVLDFYYNEFWLPMHLDKVASDLKCKEIMVFIINVGIGRKKSTWKAIQRIIGTYVDGIVGRNTINAINNYSDELFDKKFDEYEIKFYRRLVRLNPSLEFNLRGWINRANIV